MTGDDTTGRLFSRLFDRLDVYDKVDILRYMVEMKPKDQEDKVVQIDAYRRPGREIDTHGAESTKRSNH